MADITPTQIRDIAVSTVEDYLNNRVPLSQGLAKLASANDLNSEQIQRSVEATNSIAYLKILGLTDDRTVEFPLCKYAEVMQHIVVPDSEKTEIVKQAVAKYSTETVPFMEKAASNNNDENCYEMNERESRIMFVKAASINRMELEQLEVRGVQVAKELQKLAKEISQDKRGMDKLASVATGEEFKVLSTLVHGSAQEEPIVGKLGLFKEAELRQVSKISHLYKEAREILREQIQKSALQKRADAYVKAQIIKEAEEFPKAPPAATAIKTIPSAGIKSVKSVAKGLGSLAIGPVADATMYSPGVDETTGRSNDVWGNLQRNQ